MIVLASLQSYQPNEATSLRTTNPGNFEKALF